jgi:hypothetical protein
VRRRICGCFSYSLLHRRHDKLVFMQTPTAFRRPLRKLVFACALFFVSASLNAQTLPTTIPDNLKPPAEAMLILQAHAAGEQIYVCDGTNWTFSRPDATLYDDSGKQIGSHFAGPTWELTDGSRVIGKAIANATPDPQSVPWLLLEASSHEGSGILSRVTSIQRVQTKGGIAPPSGCDAAHKGQESRAHYTAVYLFYSGS